MKHQFKVVTKFTIMVEVEAESREEAEAKVWEMYENEEIDALDTFNIDTDAQWTGYGDE
jgi:DpnD/PcfM-like protein